MEDELTPTVVNSYGSAKHTVINANGQSVVYWTPLQASGTVEGVTWGKQASDSAEGELPLGAFNPILGLQYQNTSVDTQSAVLNITVKLTVKVAFKGQRLSKFDLCPVCPEPEDTILTSWGGDITSYTEYPYGTNFSVNNGENAFIIQRKSIYNNYMNIYNNSGSTYTMQLLNNDIVLKMTGPQAGFM